MNGLASCSVQVLQPERYIETQLADGRSAGSARPWVAAQISALPYQRPMCGIVAVIGSRESAPLLLQGLCQLEDRSYGAECIAKMKGERQLSVRAIRTAKLLGV